MEDWDFGELCNRRGNLDDLLTGRIDLQSFEVEVGKVRADQRAHSARQEPPPQT